MTRTQQTQQASKNAAQDEQSGRPLGGSYATAVALALIALSPFIVLSTAGQLVERQVMHDLHASMFGVQLAAAMANAAYAFGAVVAADLIRRMPARWLYVGCEVMFIGGSVLAALADSTAPFLIGRSLQGLGTGMLLVAALPPLVTRFGADKLPITAAVVNLGLFGMVTLGPLIGGVTASEKHWRVLFLVVGAFGVLGIGLALAGFEGAEGGDPKAGFDPSGIPLSLASTVLPFLGVTWITRGGFGSPGFWLPVVLGLAALLVLLQRQYAKRDALMPLKIIAHTLPVTGILTAMVAGAAVTALLELAAQYLLEVGKQPPATVGLILTTQVAGVGLAAALFARTLRTKWLPALALTGLAVVTAGGVLMLFLHPGRDVPLLAVAGFLLGFGAGAGVAPALFMAGLSAPSNKLGPTFALVELLRSEAAFLVAPVLLQIAMLGGNLDHGVRLAAVITVVLCAAGGAVALTILLLGAKKPHRPDLERWLDGEEPAYDSPPLAAGVRDVS